MECKKCGECCRRFGITLTLKDLVREPKLSNVMVSFQNVKNLKTKKYMAEKRHPFVIGKSYNGAACPFLKDNKCSIYLTRPQICREYPQKEARCIRRLK